MLLHARGFSRLNLQVASFQEFAEVCQSLSQTGSRLQMADMVGEFLARLDVDEAEIAARFMVGRSLAQGEEKRLQISGRAIWKIVAAMAGAEEQGEDIYNSAEDFGDAIGMMLKMRASEPGADADDSRGRCEVCRDRGYRGARLARTQTRRTAPRCSNARPRWKESISPRF